MVPAPVHSGRNRELGAPVDPREQPEPRIELAVQASHGAAEAPASSAGATTGSAEAPASSTGATTGSAEAPARDGEAPIGGAEAPWGTAGAQPGEIAPSPATPPGVPVAVTPPPATKRTGLVVGIVVLAVVICGGVVGSTAVFLVNR